jgi:hypothetical protein
MLVHTPIGCPNSRILEQKQDQQIDNRGYF